LHAVGDLFMIMHGLTNFKQVIHFDETLFVKIDVGTSFRCFVSQVLVSIHGLSLTS
jgi:hypothetical protein